MGLCIRRGEAIAAECVTPPSSTPRDIIIIANGGTDVFPTRSSSGKSQPYIYMEEAEKKSFREENDEHTTAVCGGVIYI